MKTGTAGGGGSEWLPLLATHLNQPAHVSDRCPQDSVPLACGLPDAAARLRHHAGVHARDGATARLSFSVVRAPGGGIGVAATCPTSTSTPPGSCAFLLSDAVAGKLLHRGAAQFPMLIAMHRLAALLTRPPRSESVERSAFRCECPILRPVESGYVCTRAPAAAAAHRTWQHVSVTDFWCCGSATATTYPRVRGTCFTRRRKPRDANTASLRGCAKC